MFTGLIVDIIGVVTWGIFATYCFAWSIKLAEDKAIIKAIIATALCLFFVFLIISPTKNLRDKLLNNSPIATNSQEIYLAIDTEANDLAKANFLAYKSKQHYFFYRWKEGRLKFDKIPKANTELVEGPPELIVNVYLDGTRDYKLFIPKNTLFLEIEPNKRSQPADTEPLLARSGFLIGKNDKMWHN